MSTTTSSFSLFTTSIVRQSLLDAVRKLDPRVQVKNPVMFIVYLGSIACTIVCGVDLVANRADIFTTQITIWLWFTVLFANWAEAVAEGRGKAQARSLRAARAGTTARRLRNGVEEIVASTELNVGDMVVCERSDVIPSDGDVVEGIASIDESAITGESAPVIRESGGDRCAVTGGTVVLSDRIIVRITAATGGTFLDRMISLVEGAQRQRTPNEIALSILLLALTFIFVAAVATLLPLANVLTPTAGSAATSFLTLPVLIALLVCLIPTTIGALLSAIGISGMDRMLRRNVVAKSGKAIEAAGDVDVLLLDKTGTITLGNRMAVDFIPMPGVSARELADAAQLASLADETPEGRSVVVLAKERFELRGREMSSSHAVFIPFTAHSRMSGVDLDVAPSMRSIRKGAADAVIAWAERLGGATPAALRPTVENVARMGGTPLVVADGALLLGVIHLKDVIKDGIRTRFEQLRRMGIRTVMVTGDNPITAAAIAAEAGVDDFIAEATPEAKLAKIRAEQQRGRLVAMIGDGTNDAPALAQADVGVAMNTGTQAAREAGNMVDLDSNPTKLIDVVEVGKQLLMTRGALTTFSIANDVAKYFAILPALFAGLYATPHGSGALAWLNIMGLATPRSAILSAVIFNALVIIALIPLALRGVSYRSRGANDVLLRNLLIFGVGGLVVPFVGIKLIDMLLVALGWR
ncbi:MAG: potassium-transporting ATPase subunit KdpB [Bacteroidetes bacterium]|nr:potassium-transporting ATPase subunit KdpB [Bacteroidota bacterium]